MKSPVYTYSKLNYLYDVKETFTAGIMLEGWEVKALMQHHGKIDTAYCGIKGNQFCMMNSKIMPSANYTLNVSTSDAESRDRVLLLNKVELNRIKEKLQTKGLTCVPVKLYRNSKKFWKVEIAIVAGKKNWDRREDIKKRDTERDVKRQLAD